MRHPSILAALIAGSDPPANDPYYSGNDPEADYTPSDFDAADFDPNNQYDTLDTSGSASDNVYSDSDLSVDRDTNCDNRGSIGDDYCETFFHADDCGAGGPY